ncbi:MAG TPA: tryptophan--tRNA ligase [Candidatus Paceibacterota bacterium]|nr:tryptophan--tRNA ligase [Candidatus Paceibacterota bacterium]
MAKKEEMSVTPWDVSGEVDYDKLIKEFGTKPIPEKVKKRFSSMHPLLRRGVYFSHRDFDKWLDMYDKKKKVSVITGRGPSEKMHLGHLVPFLVAKSLQDEFDCYVFIPISDDEKFFVKQNLSFDQALKYSEDNIIDLIALGFKPGKTFIFEDFVYTDIYKYAAQIAKRITYSTAKASFGLVPENNIGWSFYPAMQAAHILFPQFYSGKHLSVVPVGIDQDPFIRLTRDVASYPEFNFEKPAAIHAKFIPSLQGDDKMSSSGEGIIFLSDSPKEVEKKIKKYAFSGGRATVEEHRRLGGNPDIDVCFQYLKIFFEQDDKKLEQIEQDYRSGKMLSGELKEYTISKINKFLAEHQQNRELAKKQLDKFILKNKCN